MLIILAGILSWLFVGTASLELIEMFFDKYYPGESYLNYCLASIRRDISIGKLAGLDVYPNYEKNGMRMAKAVWIMAWPIHVLVSIIRIATLLITGRDKY